MMKGVNGVPNAGVGNVRKPVSAREAFAPKVGASAPKVGVSAQQAFAPKVGVQPQPPVQPQEPLQPSAAGATAPTTDAPAQAQENTNTNNTAGGATAGKTATENKADGVDGVDGAGETRTRTEKQIGNLISFVKNFSESVKLNDNGNIDIKVDALKIVQGKVTESTQNKIYQDNLNNLGLTSQTDKTITPENSHLHYFALGSALKNAPINSADADKIKSFKTGIPQEDFIDFNEKLFGKDFINQLIDSTDIPDAEKKQVKEVMAEYYKISDQYVKLSPKDITNLTEQLAGNDKSKNKYTRAQWAALPEMLKKKEIVEQNNVNKARDTLSPEQQEKFDKLSPDAQRDKVKQMLKTDNLADPAATDKLNDTSMQDALRKGYDTIGDAQQKSEQEHRDMEANQFKQQIKSMTDSFTQQVEAVTAMNQGMGKMLQGLMGLADMLSKMRQSIMDKTNQRMANQAYQKEQQERQQKKAH